MLILSDMSGSSMVQGFESYITGYPLIEVNKYVLARTWYAPEMHRPGCVWTHSLIIDFSDFASINNLQELCILFKRPLKGTAYIKSHYQNKLSMIFNEASNNFIDVSQPIALRLISSLYNSPSLPVFISTKNPSDFENTFFNIWNLQWPRLRRSFCFCTGSISNRSYGAIGFDLQAVPGRSLEKIKREVEKAIFIDFEDKQYRDLIEENTPFLFQSIYGFDKDINSKHFEKIRKFLWTFGSEFQNGRDVYIKLLQIYQTVERIDNKEEDLKTLLKNIKICFPEKQQATSLKKATFGSDKSERQWLLPFVTEGHILKELCKFDDLSMFDQSWLNVKERAKLFWENYPNEARQLTFDLLSSTITSIGIEYLMGVSEVITLQDLFDFVRTDKPLPQIFIVFKPELVTSREFWQITTKEKQVETIKLITSINNLPDSTIKEIVRSILQTGSEVDIEDLVTRFGNIVIYTALDWFDELDPPSLAKFPLNWKEILKSEPEILVNWMISMPAKKTTSQALIIDLLNPFAEEVISIETSVWLPIAQNVKISMIDNQKIETMAFLLTVGFIKSDNKAADLISYAFEIVYEAVKNDSLKYRSWYNLSTILPNLQWWQEWDRCERLRRGLVSAYIKNNWPSNSFFETLQNNETLWKVLEFCDGSKATRGFIKELIREVTTKKISISQNQEELLLRFKYRV